MNRKYDPPVLMSLNTPAPTVGAICSGGSNPIGGSAHCTNGGAAGNQCLAGNSAVKKCNTGTLAGGKCQAGNGP
jgi:hypothetical protein